MSPTLEQIKTRMLGSARLSLGLTRSLRRTLLESIINAVAGSIYLIYKYIDNFTSSFLPVDATGNNLDRWGQVFNTGRKAASYYEANIRVEGTGDIALGTLLRGPNDQIYITTAAIINVTDTTDIAVRSVVAGAAQNLSVGDVLDFEEFQGPIGPQATVHEVTDQAEDAEPDSDYKARILAFISRATYNAGGVADYQAWATEVAGITEAWVAVNFNNVINSVLVLISKGQGQAIGQAEIDSVLQHINSRRPVTADVTVLPLQYEPVDIEIALKENTPDVQNEVRANLANLFEAEASPLNVLNPSGQTNSGVIYISHIRQAVSNAVGETDNIVSSPNENIVPSTQYAALSLGNVTFTAIQ